VKLVETFNDFLRDTVNMKQARLDQLDQRVESVFGALDSDVDLKSLVVDHIPQGSWAHNTIIEPLQGREFDADFLLRLEEVPDWTSDPKQYLLKTRAAFKDSSTYKDMVSLKNRCVRITYANDCHVDVVPFLELPDGREVIVNRSDNTFEESNPEGFTDWMRDKDSTACGTLRKVIRLLKYLRDHKGTFAVKSVILTTLVGSQIQAWHQPDRYSDVPTALINIVDDLNTYLQGNPFLPTIADPSQPNTTFNHRWDQDGYSNFRDWIRFYADRMMTAFNEPDAVTSRTLWQEIFGPDFKRSSVTAAAVTKSAALVTREGNEQFIDDFGFPIIRTHEVEIECRVTTSKGYHYEGTLSRRGNRVAKHRQLSFRIVNCNVPAPFDVYWKIKNRGAEASARTQLRGEVVLDDGSRRRQESTLYQGDHYVECYIIKDAQCVAIAHHPVRVI
jgi:hypothetical protein